MNTITKEFIKTNLMKCGGYAAAEVEVSTTGNEGMYEIQIGARVYAFECRRTIYDNNCYVCTVINRSEPEFGGWTIFAVRAHADTVDTTAKSALSALCRYDAFVYPAAQGV